MRKRAPNGISSPIIRRAARATVSFSAIISLLASCSLRFFWYCMGLTDVTFRKCLWNVVGAMFTYLAKSSILNGREKFSLSHFTARLIWLLCVPMVQNSRTCLPMGLMSRRE